MFAILSVRISVFPVPGPAMTITGPVERVYGLPLLGIEDFVAIFKESHCYKLTAKWPPAQR